MNETLNVDIESIVKKKSLEKDSSIQARSIKYDFKVSGANKNISMQRRSKKGGSTYSNALLDLIYMIGKIDPYFWDKLVKDKQFPEMVSQMQEAYSRQSMEPGWSPEQVKQLEEYAEKRKSEENDK